MRFAASLSCLWPGLPQLWRDGHWRSLAIAVGCAAWLDALLLGTFVWVEWLPPWLRAAGWVLLVFFWIAAAWAGWHECRQRDGAERENVEDLLTRAQTEYLKGHWFEAEGLLQGLTARPSGDPLAILMLAKLCRRQARWEDCRTLLERLERADGCETWWIERGKERRLLDQQCREAGDGRRRNAAENRSRDASVGLTRPPSPEDGGEHLGLDAPDRRAA